MLECTVTAIAHKFPPATAEKLIHDYGDCSFVDVVQETQIVTHVELSEANIGKFVVKIFPSSQVPQFLLLKSVFDH